MAHQIGDFPVSEGLSVVVEAVVLEDHAQVHPEGSGVEVGLGVEFVQNCAEIYGVLDHFKVLVVFLTIILKSAIKIKRPEIKSAR
jgi:hypothetical protein